MVVSVKTNVANVDWLRFTESASPSTPASGFGLLYMKADGLLYTMDDAGLETGPITNAAAVILDPTSSVRNIIQPTGGDYHPLSIKNQAADILFAGLNTGDVGIGISPSYPFHVAKTNTTVQVYSNYFRTSYTPSAPEASPDNNGMIIYTTKDGATEPTGNPSLGALYLYASLDGAGDYATLRGGYISADNNSTGAVTSAYGLYYESINNWDAGSITTAYQAYFASQTDATNNYSIYTNAGVFHVGDKLEFTQTDGNEAIDSLADGYMDYLATTAHRFNAPIAVPSYERHIQLDAHLSGAPANQPAAVDFFTVGGLQFATTGAKYAFVQWEIPDDWAGDNVTFEVDWFADSGAMSGTDTVEWTVEYRSIAVGEAANNGTSVTLTATNDDDNAQYVTIHDPVTLAFDNGNQPLTAQDHIYFKISRNTGVTNDFGGTVTVPAFELIYNSTAIPTG